MAMSRCPHCESTTFEVTTQEPYHSNYKLVFVQCSRCGAPFSAQPYFNEFDKLVQIEERIKGIEAKLGIYDP